MENDCTNFLITICEGHHLTQISCYTLCRFKNYFCRANPCYRNEAWHDWVIFETENQKQIPVHLLFFVELKNVDSSVCEKTERNDPYSFKVHYLRFVKGKSDVYALVHFLPNSLDEPSTQKNWGANQKCSQESILFQYSRKRCNKTTPSI